MIPFWIAIVTFLVGALIGILLMILCMANRSDSSRKWWEDV